MIQSAHLNNQGPWESELERIFGEMLFLTMNSFNLSHKTQLILTVLATSLATASLLQAYNTHTRRVRRKQLDQDIQRSISEDHADGDFDNSPPPEPIQSYLEPARLGRSIDYDEDLIREQLARNYTFFGEDGMERVRKGRVVIVGCGGVGSWAAVMLVRSCVSMTTKSPNSR